MAPSCNARREWWAGPDACPEPGFVAAAAAQGRIGLEGGRPFVAQVEEVLGEAQEPDPLFFIESWTIGVNAAAENFGRRRENREPALANRAFDAFVPPYAVFDGQERCWDVDAAALPSAAPMERDGNHWITAGSAIDGRADLDSQARLGTDCGGEFESETGGWAAIGQPASGPMSLDRACRLLGVAAGSTREQMKAAYRRMASRYHPDRMGRRSEEERRFATERMVSINEAYRLLCGS